MIILRVTYALLVEL